MRVVGSHFRMKINPFSLFIVFATVALQAHFTPLVAQKQEKLDSLFQVLEHAKHDTNRVQTMIVISSEYATNNVKTALQYCESASQLAEKTGNERIMALAIYNAGLIYFSAGLLEQSANNFYRYLEIEQNKKNDQAVVATLVNIGAIHLQMKQLDKAGQNFEAALEILLRLQNAAQDSLQNNALATVYNNLGIVEKENNNFSKAEEHYLKGIAYTRGQPNRTYLLANLLNNLGMVNILENKFEEAYKNINESLALRIVDNDKQGQASSYQNLALYHEKLNDDNKAKFYYYKALGIANQTGSNTLLESIYENIFNIYMRIKNADSALKYHILLKEKTDLINMEETTKELTKQELTLQFQEREKISKVEQKRIQQRYLFISVLTILITVIVGLLYYLSQSRLRRLQLENANSELATKNLQLLKVQLETDLEQKNKELATNVMYQIKKNDMLENIVQKLLKHSPYFKKDNQELIKNIVQDLEKATEDNIWDEFEMRFQHVHNGFYDKLNEICPDLSPNERRVCAFLRLNMTTKEITSITGQSQRSIEAARYRLRKKLNLTNSEQGLIEFLSQI